MTEVAYDNNGSFIPIGSYPLNLTISAGSDELLRTVISDLSKLTMANVDDAEKINDAIRDLSLVNVYAASRKEAETNIKYLLAAADQIRNVSIDTSAIRLKLADLIKIDMGEEMGTDAGLRTGLSNP